jgi:methenyltetrahydromethanopterin cyclohydrolase
MKGYFEGKSLLTKTLSVNRLACKLVEKLCEDQEFYGVKIKKSDSNATIVDAGINAKGGFQAGKIITEICMGGCGKAEITYRNYGEMNLPTLFVYTDRPVIATLGSQYAGWQIKEGDYFAIGSGPGRALALKPREIYEEIGYKDDFGKAIIVLETCDYPPEKLVERLAKDCHVSSDDLTIILTPTTSIAGGTQVSGRIVETGIHKLRKLGLDPKLILYSLGCAPIPPIHPKFVHAMARTNDSILYGGVAHYVVEHESDEKLKEIVNKAPSMTSEAYGRPFIKIFKEAKYDFYKIDPSLFAPAVLIINNAKSGNTFRCGKINVEALAESFDLEKII